MKTIIFVIIISIMAINYSSEIFGFDAKQTLKSEGIVGTANKFLFGQEGVK